MNVSLVSPYNTMAEEGQAGVRHALCCFRKGLHSTIATLHFKCSSQPRGPRVTLQSWPGFYSSEPWRRRQVRSPKCGQRQSTWPCVYGCRHQHGTRSVSRQGPLEGSTSLGYSPSCHGPLETRSWEMPGLLPAPLRCSPSLMP